MMLVFLGDPRWLLWFAEHEAGLQFSCSPVMARHHPGFHYLSSLVEPVFSDQKISTSDGSEPRFKRLDVDRLTTARLRRKQPVSRRNGSCWITRIGFSFDQARTYCITRAHGTRFTKGHPIFLGDAPANALWSAIIEAGWNESCNGRLVLVQDLASSHLTKCATSQESKWCPGA